ncbi:MAG: hypothetical protein IJN90_04155 [Bacilli bacterium]|nr:hypothetical protein [Bacilli bacterium]
MKIGLDIDNVILDTDETILEEMIKEDKNKRNKGIINDKAEYIFSGMFDWSKEEIDNFLNVKMEKIATRLKAKKDAKKYINKLIENNEIILISNRSKKQYQDALKTTADNLEKNNINYTKLIITETNDKTEACLREKIDVFIDDRPRNCYLLKNNNINCILFKTKYETRLFNDLETVSNWDELYQKLMTRN